MINHREGTPYIARSADLITNNFDHRQILLSFKNKIQKYSRNAKLINNSIIVHGLDGFAMETVISQSGSSPLMITYFYEEKKDNNKKINWSMVAVGLICNIFIVFAVQMMLQLNINILPYALVGSLIIWVLIALVFISKDETSVLDIKKIVKNIVLEINKEQSPTIDYTQSIKCKYCGTVNNFGSYKPSAYKCFSCGANI